jgi:hypothetical protein
MDELRNIFETSKPEEIKSQLQKFESENPNHLQTYFELNFKLENKTIRNQILIVMKRSTTISISEKVSSKIIQNFLETSDAFYNQITEIILEKDLNNFIFLQEEISKFKKFDVYKLIQKFHLLKNVQLFFTHHGFVCQFHFFLFPFIFKYFQEKREKISDCDLLSRWIKRYFTLASEKPYFFKEIKIRYMNENAVINSFFVDFMTEISNFIKDKEFIEILTFVEPYLNNLPEVLDPNFLKIFRHAILKKSTYDFTRYGLDF